MKKLLYTLPILLLLSGCMNFATQTFRAEKLAVDTAYGSVQGFNQYAKANTNVTEADKELVYKAAKKIGYTAKVTEEARQAYIANSSDTNKTAVIVMLETLQQQSTNIVGMVKYFMDKAN